MKQNRLMGKILGILLAFVLAGAMLPLGAFGTHSQVEASPGTIYVPDDYSTIQAAVNAASPGDTIIVRSGTYTENVDVNKDHLTIQSENGPETTIVQAADPNDHVIEVTADYANISGFTVQGATGGDRGAIFLHMVSQSYISDNHVLTSYYGICLLGSSNNVITGNNVSDYHSLYYSGIGIYLYGNSNDNKVNGNTFWTQELQGYAIYLYGSVTGNVIIGNNLSNAGRIYLRSANGNTIDGNRLTGTDLFVQSSRDNFIRDNTFTNCGMEFYASFDNFVENNTVNGKPVFYLENRSDYSIASVEAGQVILVRCNNISVKGLTLSNTRTSIHLINTSNSTISGNIISHAGYGISLQGSSANIIEDNTLDGCGIGLSFSHDNTIANNTGSGEFSTFIGLDYSSRNVIRDNQALSSSQWWTGIGLYYANDNEIINNEVGHDISHRPGDMHTWSIGIGTGIRVYYCQRNLINHNAISNTEYGIYLEGGGNHVLEGNNLIRTGLFISDSYGNSFEGNMILHVDDRGDVIYARPILYLEGVTGDVIKNMDVGQVILENCESVVVENVSTPIGILLVNTSKSKVINNYITSFDWAQWASQRGSILLTPGEGISLQQSSENLIDGNRIYLLSDAIHLVGSHSNKIIRNHVDLCAVRAFYLSSSSTNHIYLNSVLQKLGGGSIVYSYKSVNSWNSPEPVTYTYNASVYTNYLGNYWRSAYSGSDADGDGIGDTPYLIDGDNNDNYPLMEPFQNYSETSPGAHTLMVAAGCDHTVGLRSDGTVVAVGANSDGQCDAGAWTDIVQIAAGCRHTVGLESKGTVVAVGGNLYGECNIDDWTSMVQIATGMYHTVGLKSDGTVIAVGDDYDGQCNVGGWMNIVQVAGGYCHTVGVTAGGTVAAAGANSDGQCNVDGWTNIIQVAAGYYHTVGLRSDGTVVAVGWNDHGQCSVGDWTNIIQVAAGGEFTIGLKSDGTVVAAGPSPGTQYDWGQGDVGAWTDIVQIAAGSYHTVGLKSDGTVVAVGWNEYGQCNVGDWDLGQTVPRPGTPMARASDINGQPDPMCPDIEYTVTAKYFDPNGREDLKFCYLQLKHPNKPLTMLWNQPTDDFWVYAGEEGENYLTVSGNSTPISEGGLEGYELAWTFTINDQWPEVENTIDLGVYAWDDSDLKSGWDYDNTKASFRIGERPDIVELQTQIDGLVARNREHLEEIKNHILTNAETYAYFVGAVEDDEFDSVFGFAVDLVLLSFTGLKGTMFPGADIHFKHLSVLSISDAIRLEEIYSLGSIIEKLGGIDNLGKAFVLCTVEELEELGKAVLKDIAYRIREDDPDSFRSELAEQLDADIDKYMDQLESLRDEVSSGLYSLSPEQVQSYAEVIPGLRLGNYLLLHEYSQKSMLIKAVADIRQEDEDDWKLQAAEMIWGVSMGALSAAAGLTPLGVMGKVAVGAIEAARKQFFSNIPKLSVDSQLMGLAAECLNDGFLMQHNLFGNTYGFLESIRDRTALSKPHGKMSSISNIELWTIYEYGSAGSTPAVITVDEYSDVSISGADEDLAEGFEYYVTVFYRRPYTSFVLIPSLVDVTYEDLIPIQKMAPFEGSPIRFSYYQESPKGSELTFHLFAKKGDLLYGLATTTRDWQPNVVTETVSTDYFIDFLWSTVSDGQYDQLSRYYDASSGEIVTDATEIVVLGSPAELRVCDSAGRSTGQIEGVNHEEIPGSIYADEHKLVAILHANDSYHYDVVGTGIGDYSIKVVRVTGEGATGFDSFDIPIVPNAIHRYTIDWDMLSQGETGVTVQIDSEGDGVFERTITSDSELTGDEFMLQTATTVDFDPDTLNLKTKGKYVTVYIELPPSYDVSQIDVSSIRLNGTVPALTNPTKIGDYDKDGIPDMMVKFDRAALKSLLAPGDQVEITITGNVSGIGFQGTDTIRVINPGRVFPWVIM